MFNLKAVNKNFNALTKTASKSLRKHSPEILTGFGIAGIVVTVVLAVTATPKAEEAIKERKEKEEKEELTKKEVVETAWKFYVPSAVTGAVSIACIIGASSIHIKRNAALATAYGMTQTAFSEYKEKVIETVGEKKEKSIQDEVDKERLKKHPVSKEDIAFTGKGTVPCFDSSTGRYFYSNADEIKKAEQAINKLLRDDMFVSLNDFYYELNVKPAPVYDKVGWNVDWGWIDIQFSSQLMADGTPCLVISYLVEPKENYMK